jgi:lipoate-protein ligase A
MARDLELLEQLRLSDAPRLWRLYTWEPWAVSLGKHQSLEAIDLEAAAAHGIDVVHRPTGGRAVLHAEELTYCVVARGIPAVVYEQAHSIIHDALCKVLGAKADLLEFDTVGSDLRSHYASGSDLGQACFATSARTEIMSGGRKVVGSAQRVIDGLVLQHGSILCGPAHLLLSEFVNIPHERRAPFRQALQRTSISLSEIAGRAVVANEVAAALDASLRSEVLQGA